MSAVEEFARRVEKKNRGQERDLDRIKKKLAQWQMIGRIGFFDYFNRVLLDFPDWRLYLCRVNRWSWRVFFFTRSKSTVGELRLGWFMFVGNLTGWKKWSAS